MGDFDYAGRGSYSEACQSLVAKEQVHICMYSETRILRTLKGNEKRYVVTKVRSIQNAIFLTGRTGFTCARERSPTEDAFSVLNVVHYSLFVR